MSLLTSEGGSATGLLGKQSAPKDLGYDAKLILAPVGSSIATKTLALTESTWLDAINSTVGARYIVLPIFYELESSPEDDVYATSSLGSVAFVREGKDTVKYSVIVTPVTMSQLRTLNGVDWEAFIVTSSGVIKGTSDDETIFSPFSISNFRVEKEVRATGSEPATVPITVTYADANEWTSFPAFVEPLREGVGANWNPRDLNDPKAILNTVTSATTTGFTIKLEGYDGVAFTGASKEDVVIEQVSDGTIVAVTTLTETAVLGTYTALATIPAETYYIGAAPVGTTDATDGYAGLRRDLIATEYVIS